MCDALFDCEDRLKEVGVPNPELVMIKITITAALASLSELPYTFGAKLSGIREIKEHIDRIHDVLEKQTEKELQASRQSNVVYVNFNKSRRT